MEQLDLEIRRAKSSDSDTLTDICRACFPEQMRWRGPKSHSKRWWDILTNAEFCEIWTCSTSGQMIGFIALVLDRTKYEDMWEQYHPDLLDTLYICVTCPILSIRRALKKLKRFGRKKPQKYAEPSTKSSQTNSYHKKRRIMAEHAPWCGPSAVIPSMQGKGVATKIHLFCFQRAKELGYQEIWTYVKNSNTKSRGLVDKLGFVTMERVNHILFYTKSLETDSAIIKNIYQSNCNQLNKDPDTSGRGPTV